METPKFIKKSSEESKEIDYTQKFDPFKIIEDSKSRGEQNPEHPLFDIKKQVESALNSNHLITDNKLKELPALRHLKKLEPYKTEKGLVSTRKIHEQAPGIYYHFGSIVDCFPEGFFDEDRVTIDPQENPLFFSINGAGISKGPNSAGSGERQVWIRAIDPNYLLRHTLDDEITGPFKSFPEMSYEEFIRNNGHYTFMDRFNIKPEDFTEDHFRKLQKISPNGGFSMVLGKKFAKPGEKLDFSEMVTKYKVDLVKVDDLLLTKDQLNEIWNEESLTDTMVKSKDKKIRLVTYIVDDFDGNGKFFNYKDL